MKRLLAACGAALFTLALATPAFAWHVVDSSAECIEGSTVITVDLSDEGPGTYTDSLDNEGSFDAEPFSYDAGPTTESAVVVTIVQVGAEGNQVAEVEVTECQPPPTTTTTVVPTTTTTVPATTSTSTPSTTVVSPVTTPAPPTAAPQPELASTGSETLWLGLSGLSALGLGSWLIRRKRTA